MDDWVDDEAAKLMMLDLFPDRDWEELTDGEREKCRDAVKELRRALGEASEKSLN